MTLESQVTNLELSKKLKELGVKQESLFYWHINTQNKRAYIVNKPTIGNPISAFTCSELGEMLPDKIDGYMFILMGRLNGKSVIQYQKINNELQPIRQDADTETNARAKMLIYLIENKLLPVTHS